MEAPDTGAVPSGEARETGRTAWLYFEKNYRPSTGWFDSVKGYPYTTMWDVASGVAATACAEKLGLISAERGSEILGRALATLANLRLYNDELPNREYSTVSAAISGPKATGDRGTGWSALDVGRLLIWLRIVGAWHPEHAAATEKIVKRWKFTRLARQAEMFGTYHDGTREYHRQEGRLGYEQYAASGYERWGIPMRRALDYQETQAIRAFGIELLADRRNVPYLTSDPFLLSAFELGSIDGTYTKLTRGLYLAQQRRWETTREITAATEDSLDRAPWFTYYSVFYRGALWDCRTHSGGPSPGNCGFSSKAALGWASLFDEPYSKLLDEAARPLASPEGFLSGRYPGGKANTALNINTNAVILEAMLYRQRDRKSFLEKNP
jgi:hypothetical protein